MCTIGLLLLRELLAHRLQSSLFLLLLRLERSVFLGITHPSRIHLRLHTLLLLSLLQGLLLATFTSTLPPHTYRPFQPLLELIVEMVVLGGITAGWRQRRVFRCVND